MNTVPLVSFVMSVYNDERNLSKAIDSMLNQNGIKFEIIIVNDGSTDSTKQILKEYSEKFNNVRIITNQKNQGLTRSLNRGIDIAIGAYIARLDSDDLSLKDRIYNQVKIMESDDTLAVVATPALLVINGDRRGKSKYLTQDEIRKKIKYVNCLQHSSVLIRKNVIDNVGKYNENLSTTQDYELWLRILDAGFKICMLDEPMVERNISNNSISRKRLIDQSINSFKIRHKYKTVSTVTNAILFLHQIISGSISNWLAKSIS